MVRVIVPGKPESRDKIIKATNSQTAMPPASLRATDKVHRDIEEFLRPFALYYDRRKNSHKNEGRSIDQIISIPLMAQSVMSCYLQRPSDARARPSSLLKKDEDYASIFSSDYPVAMYLVCGKLIKAVQSNLGAREDLAAKDRNNLIFYVAMHAAACLANKSKPTADDLSKIDVNKVTKELVDGSFDVVQPMYVKLGGTEQVAKGGQLVADVRQELEVRFK